MTSTGMHLVEAPPNPAGNIHRLFLLAGDGATITNAHVLPDTTGTGRLRLFHFNDLHNHLTELSGPTKGTHRFAQMVKRVRDARRLQSPDQALLFLSIGDDHTGSVLDELMGWRPDQFVLDASYRAYSDGGVDATVLGNHEFDRGTALLAKGIRQDAAFPVLSANVHSSTHLRAGRDYHGAAIAIAGPLRIGLIGLTTRVETRVGQPDDPTFAVASPVAVLQNILPALAPLVDVVLILSHCGYGDGAHQSGKAAAVRDIGEADFAIATAAAALTDTPMLVLGAHTHTRLNQNGLEDANVFSTIPVCQAECNGRYLGEINLAVDAKLPRGMDITAIRLHPIKTRNGDIGTDHTDVDQYEQPGDYDQDFETTTIAPLIRRVQSILNNQIARVDTDDLSFKSAVLDRYTKECALLNFMADAVVTRLRRGGGSVDFSLINAATIHAGIERGTLSMGAWFDVMPYADEIFIARINGAQLEQILHNNAKRILRAGEISKTDCTGFVGRGFLHMSAQVRYQIAPAGAAKQARATAIAINGRAISDQLDRVFDVAMPTYMALGAFGERWNGASISGGVAGDLAGFDMRALPAHSTNLVYRDEIAAFICDIGTIDATSGSYFDGRLQVLSPSKGSH